MSKHLVRRHSYVARVGHWLTVFSFFVVTLSGLAFFFPSLRWLTAIFGTPQLAQLLHPIFGIIMILGLCILFVKNVAHAILDKDDVPWFTNVIEILKGREHEVVEVGQYNAGQKMLFWTIIGLGAVLIVTGIIAWQPYFAPLFPVSVVRLCLVLHSLSAIALMLGIIVHAYMAFWYKGTIRGMIRGTVTRKWAALHHPRWLREIEKGEDAHSSRLSS
ncbi:MAG: formate dehydrogenase subunit gamma [Burkholderiales bacterium]|jgi:formate dehydrogenase-N gamma subunit|nr:formate dehydrogenase subunit gamma [Burkholderiales bacterium]